MSTKPTGKSFWNRLNPRERTLIMVLVVVFFVMLSAVLFFVRSGHLGETRRQIADARRSLDLLYTRGAVYQEQLRKKEERESTISSESLLFATLIETATSRVEDVDVTNQEEQPPIDLGAGLRRRSVEFDLRSIGLEPMVNFLATLESQAGHVIYTQRMLIRSPSANEDRLNVDVELSTWERAAQETGVAPEEGGE